MKIVFTFLACLTLLFAVGQVPAPLSNTYVNDYAGVVSAEQKESINKVIRAIEDTYSVQIAVVLIDKLPDNMSIEEYAMAIGRQWHVGNAENGLVSVAAIGEHKQRLEVARKLEGTITDIAASQITADIKPYFRKKDYAGGILNMLYEINGYLRPVQAEQKGLGEAELKKKDDTGWAWWVIALLCCTGIGIVAVLIYMVIKKNKDSEQEPSKSSRVGFSPNSLIGARYYDNAERNTGVTILSTNNYNSDYGASSSSSSDHSSSSSDYGNWGSGSSDSSSSFDSGFSGGGSSDSW